MSEDAHAMPALVRLFKGLADPTRLRMIAAPTTRSWWTASYCAPPTARGRPPLPQPLPWGVEVTVLERRDAWTKVRLAGGIAG